MAPYERPATGPGVSSATVFFVKQLARRRRSRLGGPVRRETPGRVRTAGVRIRTLSPKLIARTFVMRRPARNKLRGFPTPGSRVSEHVSEDAATTATVWTRIATPVGRSRIPARRAYRQWGVGADTEGVGRGDHHHPPPLRLLYYSLEINLNI